MVVISVLLLIGFILIVKPRMNSGGVRGTIPTNADRIIGQEALVVIDIDPVAGSGQIKVNGQTWSAGKYKWRIYSEWPQSSSRGYSRCKSCS
jgi:membrane protein implicated in regulation of membrane protease activity